MLVGSALELLEFRFLVDDGGEIINIYFGSTLHSLKQNKINQLSNLLLNFAKSLCNALIY